MLSSNAALWTSVRIGGTGRLDATKALGPFKHKPPQPPQPSPLLALLPSEGNQANTTAATGMAAVSSSMDAASTLTTAVGKSVPDGAVDMAAVAVNLHRCRHGRDLGQPPQPRSWLPPWLCRRS